jgi:molecular chaperone DnaK
MAADNKSLGRFVLDGIAPAPRGVPQIEVVFDVDTNGILNVTAKDKATGKEQSIKIEAGTGLSEEDIEKMKKDAEEHADEDKKKKELVDTRNMGDQMVHLAQKSLKDAGDKVPEDVKTEIEGKITAFNEVKDKDDIEAIKKASEELSTSMQKIGEILQKQATEEQKDAPKENVQDAEVKEEEPKEESKD